ncbi:MAG: hypothetical protein KIT84_20585 [Labilithrix sp.]|nr:hypothetical protein [Labilithrix sp.]MCW5813438.1 hypothetical protein [Labilithrix sp.]
MTTIRETLPEAHRRLFPAVYDRPNVEERRATCSDCAMCSRSEAPGTIAFQPNLKCCTYHPTLPNFLAGAVLADPDMAEGQRRMRARIASRIGITPQWVAPPRKHRVLLDAARTTSFGRSKVLLCPYFVEEGGGLCSIWRHREAVCSTFFCKHDAGAAGHAFWTAHKRFTAHVEVVLARHAARAVFPGAAEPDFPRMKLTLEDLEDRAPSEIDYAACWGEWAGREEDFYLRTFDVVRSVTRDEMDRLLAEEPRSEELARDVATKLDAITAPRLAERLVPNPNLVARPLPGGAMGVTTYSAYDPMSLTPELWAVLGEFKPEETLAETRARLDRDNDLVIADDLLLVLQNHAILVPPPA